MELFDLGFGQRDQEQGLNLLKLIILNSHLNGGTVFSKNACLIYSNQGRVFWNLLRNTLVST